MSMVRTEELADGSRVPYVSGNSFKGRLRRAGVEFALTAMGVGNELNKAQVDLLFSGGHLSKGGQAIDLARAREMTAKLPILSLLGYAAGNTMTESKIRTEHWHVVCRENAFRFPPELILADTDRRAGQLLTSQFGTRRDIGTGRLAGLFLESREAKRLAGETSDKLAQAHPDKGDSAQMIYEFQCIRSGTRLFSGLAFTSLTDMEWSALLSALWAMTAEVRGESYVWHLGGKNAVGYGQVLVQLEGVSIPDISPPKPEDTALTSVESGPVNEYVEYLRTNRDQILEFVRKCA